MRLEFCTVKQGGDQIKLLRYKVLTHTTTVSSGSRHLITTSIYSTPSLVEVLKLRVQGVLTNLWVPHFEVKNLTLPRVPVLLLTTILPYIFITNEMQLMQCSLLLSALYMIRAVFPPIIRSL
jgi:hypothetical protein